MSAPLLSAAEGDDGATFKSAGAELRARRVALQVTQRRLARIAGIEPDELWGIEAGDLEHAARQVVTVRRVLNLLERQKDCRADAKARARSARRDDTEGDEDE